MALNRASRDTPDTFTTCGGDRGASGSRQDKENSYCPWLIVCLCSLSSQPQATGSTADAKAWPERVRHSGPNLGDESCHPSSMPIQYTFEHASRRPPPQQHSAHPHNLPALTLNRTPGISPTAWPRRPNPAISTSSCRAQRCGARACCGHCSSQQKRTLSVAVVNVAHTAARPCARQGEPSSRAMLPKTAWPRPWTAPPSL